MSSSLVVQRRLGPTALSVSSIAIGCAPLGDMPETFGYRTSEDQALATLRTAFASPLNFFDTAAAYGRGESERRMGKAIRAYGGLPAGTVMATKADRDLDTGDFSGDQVRRSIEGSLERLGLAYLPLVYIHDPEHTTFANVMGPGGPLEVLEQYRDQGVIGHLGIAGGPIDLLIRYVETGRFSVVETHNRYTLLNRSAEPLLTRAQQWGVAVINAAPYGSGLLAKGPDRYARYAYTEAPPLVLERARALAALGQAYDIPLAALALQFSLRDPRVTSTVVGMTRPERITQTLALANLPIPAEVWTAVEALEYFTDDPEAHRF